MWGINSCLIKGLGNFLYYVGNAISLCRFIIFDIDFFKKVNDTYGHLAGDFILKEVVKSVKSSFRSNDLFVRCGGEEFCIIMQV